MPSVVVTCPKCGRRCTVKVEVLPESPEQIPAVPKHRPAAGFREDLSQRKLRKEVCNQLAKQ